MDVMTLANIVLIGGTLLFMWVIYSIGKPSNFSKDLNKSIQEVKEGKTTPYKDILELFKQEDEYDKAHPIQAFFKDTYYTIRRFIVEIPEIPRYGYRKIKRGIQ